MSTLMKIMLVPALVVAFSVGVALAASGGGDDQLAQVAPTSSTIEDSTTTDATTTTSTGVDVSGPCAEAEYANVKDRLPVETYVLARQPMFDIKARNFLDGSELPQFVLVSNRE